MKAGDLVKYHTPNGIYRILLVLRIPDNLAGEGWIQGIQVGGPAPKSVLGQARMYEQERCEVLSASR